jgi:hypothetical protein
VNRGIAYFIQGRQHWAVLTVSLWSVRRHFDGPIAIIAGDNEGLNIAFLLSDDVRLAPIIVIGIDGISGSPDASIANKPAIFNHSPFERTVFLDADTIVVGDFEELWPTSDEVVLTSFANWITTRPPIRNRLMPWQRYAPSLVTRALSAPYPAINTGVFAFARGSDKYMAEWIELTLHWISFACDELAAQLIYPSHRVRLVDDRYNCSPIYGHGKHDARIWHFHGKKHLKGQAAKIWWPVYQAVFRKNIGGICSWTPAGDDRLARFIAGYRDDSGLIEWTKS